MNLTRKTILENSVKLTEENYHFIVSVICIAKARVNIGKIR